MRSLKLEFEIYRTEDMTSKEKEALKQQISKDIDKTFNEVKEIGEWWNAVPF